MTNLFGPFSKLEDLKIPPPSSSDFSFSPLLPHAKAEREEKKEERTISHICTHVCRGRGEEEVECMNERVVVEHLVETKGQENGHPCNVKERSTSIRCVAECNEAMKKRRRMTLEERKQQGVSLPDGTFKLTSVANF